MSEVSIKAAEPIVKGWFELPLLFRLFTRLTHLLFLFSSVSHKYLPIGSQSDHRSNDKIDIRSITVVDTSDDDSVGDDDDDMEVAAVSVAMTHHQMGSEGSIIADTCPGQPP